MMIASLDILISGDVGVDSRKELLTRIGDWMQGLWRDHLEKLV